MHSHAWRCLNYKVCGVAKPGNPSSSQDLQGTGCPAHCSVWKLPAKQRLRGETWVPYAVSDLRIWAFRQQGMRLRRRWLKSSAGCVHFGLTVFIHYWYFYVYVEYEVLQAQSLSRMGRQPWHRTPLASARGKGEGHSTSRFIVSRGLEWDTQTIAMCSFASWQCKSPLHPSLSSTRISRILAFSFSFRLEEDRLLQRTIPYIF